MLTRFRKLSTCLPGANPCRITRKTVLLEASDCRDSLHVPSTVLVVDDHQLSREGLKRLVDEEPSLTVCGEAENGKAAIEKVLALKPDIVLMDLTMPLLGGIDATREIRRTVPTTRIVVLSLHESELVIAQAKEAGANAYVKKSDSAEHLLATIARVLKEREDFFAKPAPYSVRRTAG